MSGSSDYTRTSNLGLFKPNYNMDYGNWGGHLNQNCDMLDNIITSIGHPPNAATTLPLMDGTAAVGTSTAYARADHRHPVTDTPQAFGAVGDGTTDDTAAFNAMFAQLATVGGGRVYVDGSFYLAGAVTVPDGVEIYGNFTPTSMQFTWGTSYFQAPGSKLILGAGITLGRACILRNVMVIANNLPRTNPTTLTAANALIAQMATNGAGITLAKDNCLIDSVQVLGFNYGIFADGSVTAGSVNRHMLRNIHGDNINGIWLANGGDTCHVIGAHLWPYLTVGAAINAANARSGYGVYTKNNGGTVQVAQCTCYGQQICYMADTNTATFSQCWADGPGTVANTVGYATTGSCGLVQIINCQSVIQQFAVHHSPSNGAVMLIIGGLLTSAGPGGNTPSTGMTVAVLADGHGPVQCEGTYFSWGPNVAFWLGANSGPSIIVGNTFDDNNANWDHIWNVDPAVLPLLTKHSNRVINSTRSFTEQVTGTPAMGGVAVYDQMPQGLNNTPVGANGAANGLFNNLQVQPGYSLFLAQAGNGTNRNMWNFTSLGGGTGALSASAYNDALSASTEWLHITRAGYVPQQITLTAPTISLAGAVSATSLNNTPIGTTTAAQGNFSTLQVNPGGNLWLTQSGQGADQNIWNFTVSGGGTGALASYAWNDAESAYTQWLNVSRTGYVPQAITLTAPVITLAGATSVGTNAVGQNLAINGPVTGRTIFYQTAGSNRWWLYTDNTAESGGNAGSNFYVVACGDNGSPLVNALEIVRASGLVAALAGLAINSATGPTIRAGTGAATGTQPKGSIWLRTDGAAGSTLYVTQGGGTWAAVAGV